MLFTPMPDAKHLKTKRKKCSDGCKKKTSKTISLMVRQKHYLKQGLLDKREVH